VGDNFAKAVTGAIVETRRQWQDYRTALTERYGQKDAQVMICALTHDNPSGDCPSNSSGAAIGIAVVVGAAIAVTTATLMLRSRRRRPPA